MKTSQEYSTKNINQKKYEYLKDLVNDSYAYFDLDNTFCVFNSIDNLIILIYANQEKSIISFNLINNQIISEIKNAHELYITNFRHYLDSSNKRDLLLSLSSSANNIKIWDIKYWNCLINIKNINNSRYIYSACFLKDKNKIHILTSHCISNCNKNKDKNELIKVYELNGNKIKEIKGSDYDTYFIDTYYDNNLNKNYIITGNYGYIKSYDYNNNEIYHRYCGNDNSNHISVVINYNEKNVNLIESCFEGNIRIWDFHSGILLNEINMRYLRLYGICLLDNNNLFVGCYDKTIKLIDIKNNNIINTLKGHNMWVLTIKIINHKQYGKCLISQCFGLCDNIKLWIQKE